MSQLIDLSKVPVPDIIEPLDFEQRFAAIKQQLIDLDPTYTEVLSLESEPLVKLLQVLAYRELLLVNKINDATRANMLASSRANDLAGLAARYNLERLVIHPENLQATPPTAAVYESDEAFKRRIQMAFDGLNTAGSIDGYIFFALSADGLVADAYAESPQPCHITLTILSHDNNGVASSALLSKVRNYFGLSDDGQSQLATPSKVRPQGDRVQVQSGTIVGFEVQAILTIEPGPDKNVVLNAAAAALNNYLNSIKKLGASVSRSGIYRALHQPGVVDVNIISPSTNVVVTHNQSALCNNVELTVVGSDD